MKVYTRKEFLLFPAYTFYKPVYKGCMPQEFHCKLETVGNDFFEFAIGDWGGQNETEHHSMFDKMIKSGCSYPMDEACSRENLFDEDILYLVFENEDIAMLLDILNKSNKGEK